METAIADHGKIIRPFGDEGSAFRAVPDSDVRSVFMKAYLGAADAKQKAFKRSLKDARERDLICTREVEGIDQVWFVEKTTHTDRRTGH